MLFVEIIAVIFSLLCVIFTVKGNIWAWPIGIIGIVAYAFVFFNAKLFGDFGLQFIFMAQGLYGWWYWKKDSSGIKPPITRLRLPHILIGLIGFIGFWYVIYYMLSNYTTSNVPLIDSFVSLASLTANLLLAKKKLENWAIWILVDILYVGLFIYKGLYLSSGLYFVFLGLAILGLIEWIKEYNNYGKKI